MPSFAPPRPRVLGRTQPRLWTRPLVSGPPGPCGCGCALSPATSLGFSAVDFAENVVNIRPFPWQRWLLIHGLETLPDGRFRFRTVLVLVARQSGKTLLLEVKNLWKLFVLRVPLVIGTAQILDYAEESWDKAVEIIEGTPELAAELEHVDKTNGKKQLKLVGGLRWKIAAASRRGGRSLTGDDVNLDELREHSNWDSWSAVTKTTIARPRAQVWAFSNAGDDKSVVLNSVLATGRATVVDPANADQSFGLFEWSVPDDVRCTCARREDMPHAADCRLADRDLWAMANPSLGYGTVTEEALRSACNTDPDPVFRTECLCQRVRSMAPEWRVISKADWLAAEDPDPNAKAPLPPDDPPGVSLALYVNPESTHTAIGAAWVRADGDLHMAIFDHRPGLSWAVGRMVELAAKWRPVRIVVDPAGAVGAVLTELTEALATIRPKVVEVSTMKVRDVCAAYGMVRNGIATLPDPDLPEPAAELDEPVPVAARRLRVRPHPALSTAVADVLPRWVGGMKAFDWKSTTDLSPLFAVTNAVWGIVTAPPPPQVWEGGLYGTAQQSPQ